MGLKAHISHSPPTPTYPYLFLLFVRLFQISPNTRARSCARCIYHFPPPLCSPHSLSPRWLILKKLSYQSACLSITVPNFLCFYLRSLFGLAFLHSITHIIIYLSKYDVYFIRKFLRYSNTLHFFYTPL